MGRCKTGGAYRMLGCSSEEQLLRSGQRRGCRAGAVRKQWGSFPHSSREGKGFLKFWDWGMVGKGGGLMRSVLF